MTVPGRIEAARLLCSLDPPDWLVRHARAVAEVATWLAVRAQATGSIDLDRALVASAALLHDADKALPADHPHRRLPHGHGSAAWLVDHGHEELAPLVADHPVTRLVDREWFEHWLSAASPAALIVSYADKRAGQRLESVDLRFASWRRRYPRVRAGRRENAWDDQTQHAVRARVGRLEERVCAVAGVTPREVRRLRWTAAAFRALAPAAVGDQR